MSEALYSPLVKTGFIILFLSANAALAGAQPKTSSAPATATAGQVIEGIVVDHLGAGMAGAMVHIESLDAAEDDPPLATTTAGRTGDIRVQLPRPVAGPVRARITKEGYTTFLQEIDPTDERSAPWIDATLEGAATLAGVVRDHLFKEPVKGAEVFCESGGQDFQALTDSGGGYRFNTIAYGPATIRVNAKGFGAQQKTIRVLSASSEADFELGPERKLELIITTDDEKPAPDVRVEGFALPGNGSVNATTGPDGRVVLRGIEEETQEVRLRLNGPRYVQMRGFEVRINLHPGAEKGPNSRSPASMPAVRQELIVHLASRVKGMITDAKTGQPVVGARVIAGREFRSDAPMAWSTVDGSYELIGLPPGLNVISCQHHEYATAIQEIHLDQEQAATADVRMQAGLTVAGKVVDKTGKPVAQVYISGDEWQGRSTLGLRGITEKDGAFSFPNAPAGEIVFSFVKPGCGPAVQETLTSGKTDYRIVIDVEAATRKAAPPVPRPPRLQLGKTVPDLALVALNGNTYQLGQMRGQYIFLDIWATWCPACMAEVDNLKALRAAMKDRADFVFIGVSLDTDRDALKQALQEHGLDWPQICGPKSGAREAFETLSGVAIPYNCLIGPDGTLLAQDMAGPSLTEAVKMAMARSQASKPAP